MVATRQGFHCELLARIIREHVINQKTLFEMDEAECHRLPPKHLFLWKTPNEKITRRISDSYSVEAISVVRHSSNGINSFEVKVKPSPVELLKTWLKTKSSRV